MRINFMPQRFIFQVATSKSLKISIDNLELVEIVGIHSESPGRGC
jgi:hypothetical protein